MINVLYSFEWGSELEYKQSFLFVIALRSKTVAHTFFYPRVDNANGRLCQDPEILLP